MRGTSMECKLHVTAAHSHEGGQNGAWGEEEDGGYKLPPQEIVDIVDAPPIPALSFSPSRDRIVFLERPALASVAELARPELKLAGLRLDPTCNTRSRMSYYTGITIRELLEDDVLGPERAVTGLPSGAKVNFVSWSPDGRHLAFSVRTDDEENDALGLLGLWVADISTGAARQLLAAPAHCLNTVFESYSWVDDDTIVAAAVPEGRLPAPRRPRMPPGPKVQSNAGGGKAQSRTFQDLLKDKHDEALLEHYATCQLLLVSLDGGIRKLREPAMYTSVEPSNDGSYLLVSKMERPFSYTVPCGRFPRRIEVWTREGAPAQEVCYLPLAEDIPIAFNSVRPGRRSIYWRPDRPAQLCWTETQDGGDAGVEASPRDIVYSHAAEPGPGEEPQVVATTDLRCNGVSWGDDELALVYESWFKTRKTRTWVIAPGRPGGGEPRLLFDRSYEDSYSDPGSPVQRRTPLGTYVLAKFATPDGRQRLLLDGDGATPEGNVPFLDLFDIETGEKERIWQSGKETHFEAFTSLMSDTSAGDVIPLEGLRMLFSRESQQDPPQYFIRRWPEDAMKQLTHFPHPYPSIRDLSKEIIRYERADGVQLTATLHLPPGYRPEADGPLPMLMWAYPREYKSKDAAGQMRGSPNEFASIGSTSPLLYLARGYAVLSGPGMPIVGEGDEEANDRFLEQLVMSAQAAVDEVVRRGVADRSRIAIGGHSYGAFMTANLLAHAPDLFSCGIAESGTYNRTLTPFGFQSEDRTLWEAPDVYLRMSPFMHADKVKKPILLIHGEDDNNSGTFPLQSERFFAALKGHGARCRLVLLPHESHGYRGRESILHKHAEVHAWLDQYCAPPAPPSATAEQPPEVSEVLQPARL